MMKEFTRQGVLIQGMDISACFTHLSATDIDTASLPTLTFPTW